LSRTTFSSSPSLVPWAVSDYQARKSRDRRDAWQQPGATKLPPASTWCSPPHQPLALGGDDDVRYIVEIRSFPKPEPAALERPSAAHCPVIEHQADEPERKH
jgi:hypothetical protein